MIVNNKRYPRKRLKPELKTCMACKKKFKKAPATKNTAP